MTAGPRLRRSTTDGSCWPSSPASPGATPARGSRPSRAADWPTPVTTRGGRRRGSMARALPCSLSPPTGARRPSPPCSPPSLPRPARRWTHSRRSPSCRGWPGVSSSPTAPAISPSHTRRASTWPRRRVGPSAPSSSRPSTTSGRGPCGRPPRACATADGWCGSPRGSSALELATPSRPSALELREHLPRREHGPASQGRPYVAHQVDQHLGQLVLGPPLPEGHLEMEGQLLGPPGGGVRHHADQGARLEIQARTGPQRAEDVLGGNVDELLHHGIAVHRSVDALGVLVAHQRPPHLPALPQPLALGHRPLLGGKSVRAHARDPRRSRSTVALPRCGASGGLGGARSPP